MRIVTINATPISLDDPALISEPWEDGWQATDWTHQQLDGNLTVVLSSATNVLTDQNHPPVAHIGDSNGSVTVSTKQELDQLLATLAGIRVVWDQLT